MAIKNRKCLCCQKSYSYCPDCSNADKLAPAWKSQFCSESCAQLWTTLTKYGMGRMTKEEAREIILNLDLKPIDSYANCVKRDYDKIMSKSRRTRKEPIVYELPVVKPIVEVMDVEPIVQEDVHEVVLTKDE